MTEEEIIETEQRIFDIYSGILFNSQTFASGGETSEITYDFNCPEYKTLIEKYGIDRIAGEGTAFERSARLLHWMSPRLKHRPDYDNHVPCNALDLLDYSLDRPDQGINCLNKAKILTECCLAVGIHARRVLILPCSPYDYDNHVVTEIFDPDMDQWVMLDPSTDAYFADDTGRPLSALELRDRYAHQRFAVMVTGEDSTEDLASLKDKHAEYNTYFCKNLFRIIVDSDNRFGKSQRTELYFTPIGYSYQKNNVANAEYRLRSVPPEPEYDQRRGRMQQHIETIRSAPEPPACDISLLTAPPQ